MINCKIVFLNSFLWIFFSTSLCANEIITIKHQKDDITSTVREALEKATDKNLKIVFEKGTYLFLPDYAQDKYTFISNHGNGLKKIAFLLEDFDSIEIEGNGSEFIFHGQIAPFQFSNCKKIAVNNITIDWDIPFVFQGEVVAVNKEEGWRDIKPATKGFSWDIKRNHLMFPNSEGFSFSELGSTLAFDKVNKRVAHGANDFSSYPTVVEKRNEGVLRFYEKLKTEIEIGTILNSCGPHEENRYAPAFEVVNSKNIYFDNIVIHHALGMGFLFERSQDITINKCGVYVREGSERVVSTIADATHFVNCKGAILIENSTFKQMLDDGTNVHGTYVEANKIIDSHRLRYELKHFEQLGFEFAGVGDEIWLIQNPSSQRAFVNVVTEVKRINDRLVELTFKNELPKNFAKGDVLENKTWNPSFTMRNCTVKDNRARNLVLKTPEKILIENNNFSSMMSSIFFRGETYYWFESGAVRDVLIRNNQFQYCAYSATEHAVLYITPRLGTKFSKTDLYDSNIRFENNTIETFDNRIVWADRVDGLTISGNTIIQTFDKPSIFPYTPLIDLTNCNNVSIENNSYKGNSKKGIQADSYSTQTLIIKKNKGFK